MRVVVEVGPAGVRVHPRNARPLPPALTEAALDWIDDPVGLLDDRPVPTAEIWRSVLAAAAGPRCDWLLVVHPDDWSRVRVKRVTTAAESVAARVVAVARGQWTAPRARRPVPRRTATAFAAVLLAVGAVTLAVSSHPQPPPPRAVGLVEGPVAVLVPADWTVERRTDGPGPPRVRVGSPADPAAALNITWSYAPKATLTDIGEALRRAAAAEPAGVFEFAPEAPAGRPAVIYREIRPGRVVLWSVLIDGSTQIAVGCQSAPDREVAVRAACDQAVRTARDVTGRSGRPF